jgi:hypothetical protein
MKSKSRKFWLLLVVLFSGGCAVATEEDMIGLYTPNFNIGKETLELLNDGTYVHLYQGGSNKDFINKGSWSINSNGRKTTLTLKKFKFAPIGESNSPWFQMSRDVGSFETMVLKGRNGTIRITVDEDEAFYFFKE